MSWFSASLPVILVTLSIVNGLGVTFFIVVVQGIFHVVILLVTFLIMNRTWPLCL